MGKPARSSTTVRRHGSGAFASTPSPERASRARFAPRFESRLGMTGFSLAGQRRASHIRGTYRTRLRSDARMDRDGAASCTGGQRRAGVEPPGRGRDGGEGLRRQARGLQRQLDRGAVGRTRAPPHLDRGADESGFHVAHRQEDRRGRRSSDHRADRGGRRVACDRQDARPVTHEDNRRGCGGLGESSGRIVDVTSRIAGVSPGHEGGVRPPVGRPAADAAAALPRAPRPRCAPEVFALKKWRRTGASTTRRCDATARGGSTSGCAPIDRPPAYW
jgi:hypothetical protein